MNHKDIPPELLAEDERLQIERDKYGVWSVRVNGTRLWARSNNLREACIDALQHHGITDGVVKRGEKIPDGYHVDRETGEVVHKRYKRVGDQPDYPRDENNMIPLSAIITTKK